MSYTKGFSKDVNFPLVIDMYNGKALEFDEIIDRLNNFELQNKQMKEALKEIIEELPTLIVGDTGLTFRECNEDLFQKYKSLLNQIENEIL